MKYININNVPSTEIYVNQQWFYVPDYVFTDSPEDYKEPIKTRSWRDKDGKNMYDKEQKFIMRGSYAGLVEIAAKKESGKYVYDYYLATKIGKKIGRIFKKTGQRFFYITTLQEPNNAWQVHKKIEDCIEYGFLDEVSFIKNKTIQIDDFCLKNGKILYVFSIFDEGNKNVETRQIINNLTEALGELL